MPTMFRPHVLASFVLAANLVACGGSSTSQAPDGGAGDGRDQADGEPQRDGDTQQDGGDDGASDGASDGADGTGDGGDGTLDGYELIWRDEFDQDGLPDETRWNYEVQRPGWVNEELQNYTDHRAENVRIENGVLIVEARRDDFDGAEYSSARIHSAGKGELTYGRVVVRARVPEGRGTWPALWMMPADVFRYASTCSAETGWIDGCDAWPASGEIDIMEHVGYDPNVVHATIHCRAYNWMAADQRTAIVSVPDATRAFHEYALERSADRIEVSVDGQVYFTYDNDGSGPDTWPFDAPFYMIINLAVGGIWGGAQGVDADAFPQRLEVDYVRMYERR